MYLMWMVVCEILKRREKVCMHMLLKGEREHVVPCVCACVRDTNGEIEDVSYLVCVYEVLEGAEWHKAWL